MDWLSFIAALVDALAWPAAVFGIVLILRRPLTGLIPLLHRLKYKDLELEFEQQVAEVSDALEAEPAPTHKALPTAESPAVELAQISPRAGVLEAWRELEGELRAVADRNAPALEGRSPRNAAILIKKLEEAELIDSQRAWMLNRMRALRNGAAHLDDFALGMDAAVDYVNTAERLKQHLKDA